jgi:hypothetical protein
MPSGISPLAWSLKQRFQLTFPDIRAAEGAVEPLTIRLDGPHDI